MRKALSGALVAALAFSVFLVAPPLALMERAEPVGPVAGVVMPGQWVRYAFPARAGWTYTIRLEPQSGDPDVWLYADGQRLAVGDRPGLAVEELVWTPQQDSSAIAWVTGFGRRVEYVIDVHGGDAVAARAQASVSARGSAGTPTATQLPQPAARSASGKIGLQVGHWKYWEAGPPFNNQPGSSGGGKTESEVNLAIAQLAAGLLRELGYAVDLLPTAFARGYRADVVVAIHADGGPSTRRGFFADRAAGSALAAREDRLVNLLDTEYAQATDVPYHYRGTEATRYYYEYYRVTKDTPMALIETGFLTNVTDREILIGDPLRAARGIATAIDRFLRERQ